MKINDIWNELYKKSHGFCNATVLENAFDESYLSETDINEFIAHLQCRSIKDLSVRTYLDGSLHYNYLNKLQDETITNTTSLETWGNELFEGKKYGIVINNAEKISETLTSKFTSFSKFLHNIKNPFILELDLALFIGNYGYTPFGIHEDGYNQSVIHFHIGPNPKIMYVWEPEYYLDNGGIEGNNFEIDEMLPYAKKYVLPPNSVFFLPKKQYHVGFTKDFSIGCTIGLFEFNKKELLKNSIEHSLTYTLEKDTTTIINETPNVISILKEPYQSNKLDNSYKNFIEEYILSQKSNCLFKSKPIKNNNIILHNNDTIQLKNNYKIYHKTVGDWLILYIRGQRLQVPNIQPIIAFIDKINNGHTQQVAELISNKQTVLSDIIKNLIKIISLNQLVQINSFAH